MTAGCHEPGGTHAAVTAEARIALVGSPNAGKTSVFNALTGLRARTGNYPGVNPRAHSRRAVSGAPSATTSTTLARAPGTRSASAHSAPPDTAARRPACTASPPPTLICVSAAPCRTGAAGHPVGR